MKATEQTLQEVERAIRKVAEKFPPSEEATLLTDIHLRVSQDSGEMLAYDDDDNEINRCVVEQWIENKDDDFYQNVAATLRSSLHKQKEKIEQMSILKPYSFVLEDDDKETIEELYLVDDDTVILHEELMAGLDKDLDEFLEQLLKDEYSKSSPARLSPVIILSNSSRASSSDIFLMSSGVSDMLSPICNSSSHSILIVSISLIWVVSTSIYSND